MRLQALRKLLRHHESVFYLRDAAAARGSCWAHGVPPSSQSAFDRPARSGRRTNTQPAVEVDFIPTDAAVNPRFLTVIRVSWRASRGRRQVARSCPATARRPE